VTKTPPTNTPLPGEEDPVPGGGDYATREVGEGGNDDVPGTLECAFPTTGKLLTFCATHDFQMVAPKLIGFDAINMTECATVDIQNVP
jgi:hypothetical protein